MIVKICGITNLEDALVATDAGATALGFNFYQGSPRFIEPAGAEAIIAKLPAAIWKVGVFVNEPGAPDVARDIGLDVLQLHGDEPPSAVPKGIRVWKAFRVTTGFEMSRLAGYRTEAILLDGPAPGSGLSFDWAVAAGPAHKLILAGGLDDTNVRRAIETVRPWGVDACSSLEVSPGRKDHVKISRFLKAAL